MKKRSREKEAVVLRRLQLVKDEIKHYPTPVSGCDEQFNFLLSNRDRLALDLTEIRRSSEKRKDLTKSGREKA